MNKTVVTFLAAFVAMAAALAVYDLLVARPRALLVEQAATLQLGTAKREADAISRGLEASLDRSIERAKDVTDVQVRDQERLRQTIEPLLRAAQLRTALTEVYQSEGQWPSPEQLRGMVPPDEAPATSAGHVRVEDGGVVVIRYDARYAAGSEVRMTPTGGATGVRWDCHSRGDADLKRFIPSCTFMGGKSTNPVAIGG